MKIPETINNFATELGLRTREYRVGLEQINGLRLFVFKNNELIRIEGPYPSEFDCGLNIGRKRLWGKLENITGILMALGGLVGVYSSISDISNPEGGKLLLSLVPIGVGGILFFRGREKKDIATAIIRILSHDPTSNS